MSKEIKTGVGVIGGGAAGLMVTNKLSELGYKVTLVEKNTKLADGPSTKNEGWLHAGGYHASIIDDSVRAGKVVEQILYGHEQIAAYAPEAVEDPGVRTLSLVHNDALAERAEERWQDLGIKHRKLTHEQLKDRAPEVDTDYANCAYEMDDKSLNFRVLYQKLLHQSERSGAQVVTGATFMPEEENKAGLIFPDGSKGTIKADLFICTTGLGTKDLFEGHSDLSPKIRFWKSHSLILPRVTRHSLYYLDPKEASVMNHGEFSIACQSEDDFLVDQPTFDLEDNALRGLRQAVTRLIPSIGDDDEYPAVACVKPDIVAPMGSERSIDDEIHEPLPNYIAAFPGKVTTSPYMADKLVQRVFSRQSDERIAFRPGDTVIFNGEVNMKENKQNG